MAYNKLFKSNDGYGGRKYGVGKVQVNEFGGTDLIGTIRFYKSEKLAMKKLKM